MGLFSLNRQVSPLATRPIGPNPVLPDQKPPSLPAQAQPPSLPKVTQAPGSTPTSPFSTTGGSTILISPSPGTGDRLFNLVAGTYLALNYSDPFRTQECWLCLVSGPPYYEGVTVIRNYTNLTAAPDSCANTPSHRLTLPEVSGRGLCLGNVPPTHQTLYNTTQKIPIGNYFLAAPKGTYWACNTGLTPCISATVLNQSSDYCVLVKRLAQRQKLFDSQQGWFEGWFNRSPWFATLLSTLMGPLLILLLILLFGPCILNRLVQFMRDRLSVIQTLVLTQQYHRLRQQETEIS